MRITRRGHLSDRPHRYMSTVERFDAQYMPIPEAGCWLWIGTKVKGYGQFRADGSSQLAHRYSLAQALGRQLLPDMFACHKCDTPSCVNPDHLFEGTVQDNVDDLVRKGLQPQGERLSATFKTRCHGRSHHSSRLIEPDVLAICASSESLKTLATTYKVSRSTISKIKKGLIWKHITEGVAA